MKQVRMPRHADIDAIAALFREALQLQAAAAPEPYLKLDITLPQLKTVMVLFAKGSMPTSSLARSTGVSAAVATGIVDRLEAQALVCRQAHTTDRRVTLVALTPGGEQLVEEIRAAGVRRLTALLKVLSDEQLRDLRSGYAALVEALREHTLGGGRGDA